MPREAPFGIFVLNTREDRKFWTKIAKQSDRCCLRWPSFSATRNKHSGEWTLHGPRPAIEKFTEIAVAASERLGAVGPSEYKVQRFLNALHDFRNPPDNPIHKMFDEPDVSRFKVVTTGDRLIKSGSDANL